MSNSRAGPTRGGSRGSRSGRSPLHAVILAGGAGERFWPASRRDLPKPFLKVVGGKSLLEATLARARRFATQDRIWIVCGSEHAQAMKKASGLPPSRILVEPLRRNTAMAAAWAAERIAAEDPTGVMAVLSADHHVPDAAAFARAIKAAAKAVAENDALVTLGVTPVRPDTGYGYIHRGAPVGDAHPEIHRVRRFVEKPDSRRARRFLTSGEYLWNAGVFIWSARFFLEQVEFCAPELHRALTPLRRDPRRRDRKALEAAYRRAPSWPVDVAVMERSKHVWTLPVDFAWSDVGTWASLAGELGVGSASKKPSKPGRGRRSAPDSAGNCVLDGDVVFEDASANLVWGGERLVALLGVDDLAVVDTEDVLLVTKLDRSSDVRRIVAALKKSGRQRLT